MARLFGWFFLFIVGLAVSFFFLPAGFGVWIVGSAAIISDEIDGIAEMLEPDDEVH